MQFAVALSKTINTESAAQAVAEDIRTQLNAAPIDLACVFFSAHHAAGADLLAHVLTGTLRPSLLIGCSGEGVIAGAEELETAPAITVWAAILPDVNLHPLRSSFSPTHDQFHLSGWPEPGVEEASSLLLADPFTVPVQDILRILEERYLGTTVVGGLAGGGQEAGMNRLILNDQALDSGLVGVRLSGSVDIRPIISQGCRLIGDRFVVTKAERNLIHELGGAPDLEQLQALFESLTGKTNVALIGRSISGSSSTNIGIGLSAEIFSFGICSGPTAPQAPSQSAMWCKKVRRCSSICAMRNQPRRI